MSANLDRLGKILALADHGATEEERQHALRTAETMAATLGVELAVARAHHATKSKRETPEKRQIKIGDERSRSNAYLVELFGAIADPHDVIVTVGWRNLYVVAYGLPSDLDIVEALYGTAAVRMVADANTALRCGKQKSAGRFGGPVDGRTYRAHFYRGYRSQLQTRLWEARHAAIRNNSIDATQRTSTEIVLRDKEREVRDFYQEATKHWNRRGTWKPPQRDDHVRDAVARGSASAANTDLHLTTGIGAKRPAGALEPSPRLDRSELNDAGH